MAKRKSAADRKLDLIFECLMHLAKKVLDDDERHELLECLQSVNAVAMGLKVVEQTAAGEVEHAG